jgi:CRISPR-associated protein Cas1
MIHQLLNTLYITTEGSYLRVDHETLKIDVERETKLQIPIHHIGGVVCFGDVLVSPAAIHRCVEDGRFLVFLDRNGRFKARVEGPVSGNVLLRCAQHDALANMEKTVGIARNIIAGKLQNTRQIVLRGAREASAPEEATALRETAEQLAGSITRLASCDNLDSLRGIEGEAAREYFSTWDRMVREDRETFALNGRNRRPPKDPTNALLSFLYALLMNDCVAAAEGVGLDPQMGFLHALRPGRAALALDLMEELRSVLADRLVLTLINRKQVTAKDFVNRPGGAIHLVDEVRKEVIVAYQKRKQEEITHPTLDQKMPLGLVPHIQARLLARVLRGDMDEYVPFLYR